MNLEDKLAVAAAALTAADDGAICISNDEQKFSGDGEVSMDPELAGNEGADLNFSVQHEIEGAGHETKIITDECACQSSITEGIVPDHQAPGDCKPLDQQHTGDEGGDLNFSVQLEIEGAGHETKIITDECACQSSITEGIVHDDQAPEDCKPLDQQQTGDEGVDLNFSVQQEIEGTRHETKILTDECACQSSIVEGIVHDDQAPGDCKPLDQQQTGDEEIDPNGSRTPGRTPKKTGETNEDIKVITDDSFIPSPLFKGFTISTCFGPDDQASIQILESRYNSLLKKYQEQVAVGKECEQQRRKYIDECATQYETMKQKYTKESEERKQLYNEMIELKGNIRVFCRCRPLNSDENYKGFTSVLDPEESSDMELQIICADSSRKKFKFDHVFGPQDNQEAVFAEALPIVRSALDGYNVCIFAYGQTGTGKTFTMEGTSENRGVNYRALEELFDMSQGKPQLRFEFFVSMLEVYNEKIRDLLADGSDQSKRLEIKQTGDGSQEVPGLVETKANNANEVWDLFETGGKNRAVGSTNANELSSRSHCLVRLTITSEDLMDGRKRRSHLWLVDLAGSERIGKVDVEGERLKESQFINKSLSALGDVISALASKNSHIPYRNSKLTHLLQSSLGGDCKTLMFVQISPSSADLGETLCSLNFASRVRSVEHGPTRKMSDPAESFKIKQLMETLRQEEKETTRLKDSLAAMQLKCTSRDKAFKTLTEKVKDMESANRSYQLKIKEMESTNRTNQQKLKEGESANRNYQQKIIELESQLARGKKAAAWDQLEGVGSSQHTAPPASQRLPLGRITNRLPPPGPCRNTTSLLAAFPDKENGAEAGKRFPYRRSPLGKFDARRAQRNSLALPPGSSDIPLPRRRASIAVPVHASTQRTVSKRDSFTPFLGPGGMSSSMGTSDMRGKKYSRFGSGGNSSKYSSTPQKEGDGGRKSLIPSIATSSRVRLQLVSSPACASVNSSSSHPPAGKFCFSVHKRIGLSPRRPQSLLSELAGLTNQPRTRGTAQRVLVNNRRKSVI